MNGLLTFYQQHRAAPREGVYIHGLFLEGARWDSNLGVLAEARLKELHPPMPVIYVKVTLISSKFLGE